MRQKHDKTAILEKGIQLFREKGYHNTGVDDILRSCKIPSGSFYNFFKNKEGFAIQALAHYNDLFHIELEKILNDTSKTPLQRIKKIYSNGAKEHKQQDCKVGCLLNSMTSEVAATSPLIEQQTVEDYKRTNKLLSKIILEGQKNGEIRKDFSASELADYLINGFMGATIRMKAGSTDKPLKLFLKTAFDFLAL